MGAQYEQVKELIFSRKKLLCFTLEDEKLLLKLWDSYWKKNSGNLRGEPTVLACAILWRYSSDNYLWEENKDWAQQNLAERFGVRGKTVGSNASTIRNSLNIKLCDSRFCRKEVAESNPMNNMVMLESGLIASREMAMEKGLPFAPSHKTKEDYFYDGLERCEEGNEKKALYCFKKALELDDEFVDAHNGIGEVYFENNLGKAKKHFQKAYELTKKKFPSWPKELQWDVLENRQYLRAIQYRGLTLWCEGDLSGAMENFKLLLQLNPNDNQGARYAVAALYKRISWEEYEDYDGAPEKEKQLLEEMNTKYGFWKWKE